MIMWEGVKELTAKLGEISAVLDEAVREAIIEVASLLDEKAKENASGRPGPNVISGTLRRGIRQTPAAKTGRGSWTISVGPTAGYSRRVELGYRGTDSLGRTYATSGYPYFVPAYEFVMLNAALIYERKVREVLYK